MKKTIQCAALFGALVISGTAFAQNFDAYTNNPGRQQAQSHTGKCDGYDGTATTTGAGAGGFGFQTGPGYNQKGGNQGQPNYNPLICGNPNDNALTRGPN
jgi:hypothetical protein